MKPEIAQAQSEYNFEQVKRDVENANKQLRELAKTMRTGGNVDTSTDYRTISIGRIGKLRSLMEFHPEVVRPLFLDDEAIITLRTTPELSLETPANKPQVREGTLHYDHEDYFSDDGRMISVSLPRLEGTNPSDSHYLFSDRYQTRQIDLSQITRGSSVRAEGRMVGSAMFVDRLTPLAPR